MLRFFRRKRTDDMQGETSTPPFIFAGLGNPGRQYKLTRHNIGFMVLDHLAMRLSVSFSRVSMRSLIVDTRFEGTRLVLAKPQTYMNESGAAVGSLVRFYKVPLENLVVAHDDLDLPLGTLRLRPGGSSPGQKGVTSIIEKLGTQEFPRLRMGIGRPPGQMNPAAYVLQEFSKQEVEQLPVILDTAVDALLLVVTDGLEKAMNRYNGKVEV
jgi:PTH1 family peptidyl-tRNA hydrolase